METRQGYSILRFNPFWEVVETQKEGGGLEHIVVDTSPRLKDRLPVKVYGPASKQQCTSWARLESLLYLTVKGTFVTDELIGGEV